MLYGEYVAKHMVWDNSLEYYMIEQGYGVYEDANGITINKNSRDLWTVSDDLFVEYQIPAEIKQTVLDDYVAAKKAASQKLLEEIQSQGK